MTEISYPFGPRALAAAGKTMTVDQWASMARYLLGTGVMSVTFQDEVNELLVSPGGAQLQVDIDTGAAWIQGFYYNNNSHNTITIPQNSNASDRIDLIVIECKWGKNAGATAKVIVNPTPGTVAPVPVQVYGVKWQLPLATVTTSHLKNTLYTASDVLDQRVFSGAGCAQSNAITVAMPGASPKMRANADFTVPYSPTQSTVDAADTINAAFSALPAAGGCVQLSEGAAYFATSIEPTVNSILSGIANGTTLTWNGVTNDPMVSIANDGVRIADLTLNGGGGAVDPAAPPAVVHDAANGISISASGVQIQNVNVYYAQRHGIAIDESSDWVSGIRIDGCVLSNINSSGIVFSSNSGSVRDCTCANCGYAGIYLWANTSQSISNNKIQGNTISGTANCGIIVSTVGSTSQNWYNAISDNLITAPGQHVAVATPAGILVDGSYNGSTNMGCSHISIVANTVTGTLPTYGILLNTGVEYCSVLGNNCADAGAGSGVKNQGSHNTCAYNIDAYP
jgi:parallel beta-helix repeat protein